MRYKFVDDNDGKRYLIVNADSYGLERTSDSNLNNNERKIIWLRVKDCPILNNTVCVILDHQGQSISSICKELFFPFETIKQLRCDYDNSFKMHKVFVLKAEKCLKGENDCFGCDYLEEVVVPHKRYGNLPKESHACVVCGAV